LAFPSYTHRYRLTIEIDTPDGVRSGSSVIEVTRKDVRWILIAQGRYEFHVRGEAVFVDLGAGRNVIALLAHGPRADGSDWMISLPIEAYGYYKWDEAAWTGKAKMQGPVELKPSLIPTLVTFADLRDPKSGQVIPATAQSIDSLGPDVRFRRAWLEHLPVRGWPLSLFDTSVTHQIEQKIPFLLTHREQLRRIINDMPPRFQPHYHYFRRD
jgi:hypothetical protein